MRHRFFLVAIRCLVVLLALGHLTLACAQDVLVASGATWRYLDDGSDQGVMWQVGPFDDSSWAVGTAPLGYGHMDVVTVVDDGTMPGNRPITTYFRRTFQVADPSSYEVLLLRLRRDDGAVVFLNGSEVFRSNLSSCFPVDFETRADADVTGSEELSFLVQTVAADHLVAGDNVLAIELHQSTPDSQDLILDLELLSSASGVNASPSVSLSVPTRDDVFVEGSSVVLQALANDADGAIDRVEFFADNRYIGSDTSGSPYSAIWQATNPGDHFVSAIAFDEAGAWTSTARFRIQVISSSIFSDGFE